MSDTFYKTREAWLTSAVAQLAPQFASLGSPLPPTRVSVGWPGGRNPASTIGQCWAPSAASDGVQQIFISPMLIDPPDVLAVLTHELCHAADGCEHGHKGLFARLARGIGLEGKLTATHAGDDLKARLNTLSTELGAYPHAAISLRSRGASPRVPGKPEDPTTPDRAHPPQTTRMIKCACPMCGYTARTTRKWLDAAGAPICPTDNETMEVQS
jgi:hypothetical protein